MDGRCLYSSMEVSDDGSRCLWEGETTRLLSQGDGRWATSQRRTPSLVTCVNVSGLPADNSAPDTAYQGQTVSLFPLTIDSLRRIRIPLPSRMPSNPWNGCWRMIKP